MSIFSIFLNQPRVASPEAAAAPAAAPSGAAPTQAQVAQPTVQAAPAAPVRPHSAWSFATTLDSGLTLRSFRNDHEDPAAGWAVRLCGGPRYQSSPRVSWTPSLCYTHEGFSGIQDATVDTVAARINMGIRLSSGTNLDLGFGIGASLLSATASLDGSTGLLYDNQSLHYSADNWGIHAGGNVGFNGRIYNGESARIFLNAGYSFNFNMWGLTPDAIDRSPTDSAVSVPSVAHMFTGGITILLGRGSQPRLAPAPEAARPITTPVAQPAPAAPEASAPAAAAAAPAAAPTAAPQPSVSYTDPVSFSLPATARNAATGMAVSQGMNIEAIDPNLLPNNSRATFLVSYRDNRNGSILFDSHTQVNGSDTINRRPPSTNIPMTAQQVHDLMENLKEAGLPRHAATRANHPVRLTVSRDAQGRISLSSY